MKIHHVLAICLTFHPMLDLAQSSQRAASSHDSEIAVRTIQLLNAAETQYQTDHHKYVTAAELGSSGILKDIAAQPGPWHGVSINLHNPQHPLAGYRLTINPSSNGDSYLLALVISGSGDCGVSYFSNETGLVWHARDIQCPIDATPTARPGNPQ